MYPMAPNDNLHRPGDKEVRQLPVDDPDKVNYRLPRGQTIRRVPEYGDETADLTIQ